MKRADRIAALSALAGMQRDADLARLAGVSARFTGALESRNRMDAALAREIALVHLDPDLPVLQALNAHVLLAECARAALETQIARLAEEREVLRRLCTTSFGRADVLEHLCARQQAVRRAAG